MLWRTNLVNRAFQVLKPKGKKIRIRRLIMMKALKCSMKLEAVHTRVDVDYEIEILKEHAKILASGQTIQYIYLS